MENKANYLNKHIVTVVIFNIVLMGIVLIATGFITGTVKPNPSAKHFKYEENYEVINHNSDIHKVLLWDSKIGEMKGSKYSETVVSKANQFADKWLELSRNVKAPEKQQFWLVKKYVEDLNTLALDYFSYENGRSVVSISQQYADCDLYAYLIMSAAKLQGVDLSVILSPGHAFLNWNNPNGPDMTWEATSNKFVDFNSTSIYRISTDDLSYVAATEADLQDVVEVQFLLDNKSHFSQEELRRIADRHKDENSPYNVLTWDKFTFGYESYSPLISADFNFALDALNERKDDIELMVDMHSYIKNHKQEEERLLEHLESSIVASEHANFSQRLSAFLSAKGPITALPSMVGHGLFAFGSRFTDQTPTKATYDYNADSLAIVYFGWFLSVLTYVYCMTKPRARKASGEELSHS